MSEYLEKNPFEPWIPTYADIIHKYEGYGFPGLSIDAAKFPQIVSRRAEIELRFYQRYATRRLNKETLTTWQVRLQNRFDEVAPEFERAFRLYAEYAEQMDSDMLSGYKHVSDTESKNSGDDTTESESEGKNIDTPDSRINENPDYADSLTKDKTKNKVTYGSKNEGKATITHTVTGAVIIENLNKAIADYKDIDTEFVKAFENNFLNLFWS